MPIRPALRSACLVLAMLLLHASFARAQEADAGPAPTDAGPADAAPVAAEADAVPAEAAADAGLSAAAVADEPLPHQAGGYTVAPPVGQGSATRVAKQKFGPAAQLLTTVDEAELEGLLRDDRVVAQQKIDGIRIIAHVGDAIVATNRNGERTDKVSAGILDGLSALPAGTWSWGCSAR